MEEPKKRGKWPTFNFAKRRLDSLPSPKTGKAYYRDSRTRGLILAITPKGTKSFLLHYRIPGGRAEKLTIGRYSGTGASGLTVHQARAKADELNARIAQRQNPAADRRAQRGESTLGELWEKWLNEYARPYKKSWQFDKGRWDNHLKHWKSRKLSDIERQDVQKLHRKIGEETGERAANMVISLLRAMYQKARDQWGYMGPNPAERIKRFKERSRERFLQADELPRFFKALNEEPNQTARDYFLIALLTGARRRNVAAMRWQDVDLKQGTWTIPAATTKTAEDYLIPLVPTAIEILSEREKKNPEGCPWVFPSKSASGHIEEPKSAWARILERAKIKDLRIHDLRRTLGSWQAATGATLPIIGKTLGHKNQATTAIYSRLSLDPVRVAMETATEAMLDAGKKEPEEGSEETASEDEKVAEFPQG